MLTTRPARPADLRVVARIMQRGNVPIFAQATEVKKYANRRNQRVALTHDAEGHVYSVLFYRLLPVAKTINLDSFILICEDHGQLGESVQSIRSYLIDLLIDAQCEWIVTQVHDLDSVFAAQLLELGFLKVDGCDKCQGGQFVFSIGQEHIGGVVIERIIAGNVRTFGV